MESRDLPWLVPLWRALGALPLGLLVLTGCEDVPRGEVEWSGTVDTLTSGLIRVTNPSEPVWPLGGEWEIVEEVRVGSREGGGADGFGQIVGMDLDPLGRMLVLDAHARELRVFAASGEHVRSVGRPGSGPGEFEQPMRVDVDRHGRSWVTDPGNARVSVFDSAGAYMHSHRIPGGFVTFPWPGGFDEEDRYYAPAPDQDFRMELVRYGPDWSPVASLAVPNDPIDRPGFQVHAPDGRVTASARVPFQGRLHWRLSRQGTTWALVTDQYRLTEVGVGPDTLRIVTRDFDPIPITAADRDRAREELDWFIELGGDVDWSLLPEVKPVADGFFLDDESYIWVHRAAPEGVEADEALLDVFDPEGRFLGTVRAPFRLDVDPAPVVRGGTFLGVTRDEFEVPYLVRASIQGR